MLIPGEPYWHPQPAENPLLSLAWGALLAVADSQRASRLMEAAVSIKVQVADFLIQNGSAGYCNECISEVLGISAEGVHQATSELTEERFFTEAAGQCSRCHEEKQVSWCRCISSYACCVLPCGAGTLRCLRSDGAAAI